MRIVLRGKVRVHPTEDAEKVKRAVANIFPTLNPRLTEGEAPWLTFEGEGLEVFTRMRGILQQDRIRDAVRKALFSRVKGNCITFYLNKQVAFVNHISLCEPRGESPLGPIEVEVECDDPIRFIQWLSPSAGSRE